MFENIKLQLWDILKKKDVSLVMIFNKNGDILWHKGRKIPGKSIHHGVGFSKSYARKVISQDHMIEKVIEDQEYRDGITGDSEEIRKIREEVYSNFMKFLYRKKLN